MTTIDEFRTEAQQYVTLAASPFETQTDTWRGVIDTTAGGEATIFQNGTVIQCNWAKPTRETQLSFTDTTTGNEIPLAYGQTWISILPTNTGTVSWK
jgi:hypothetical protein